MAGSTGARVDGTLALLVLIAFGYVLVSGAMGGAVRPFALLGAAFLGVGFGGALITRMFESGRAVAAFVLSAGVVFIAVWTWFLVPTNAYQCQELVAEWINRGWWQ